MPFGLKNVGAAYQREDTTLIHDIIYKEVEVYIDDMIVKMKERGGHLGALRSFFKRMRKYQMRLNPQKCTFRISTRKLLRFFIT